MTIKDFKVGQSVVMLGDGYGSRAKSKPVEATVRKVGRKYVTVVPSDSGCEMRYRDCEDETLGYLIEQTEIGASRILFPSMQAANEYRECEALRLWVHESTGWSKIGRYSLDQLREVKRILEGDWHGQEE